MKTLKLLLASILAISIIIFSINYFSISKPTQDILKLDNRNEGISIDAHYKYYVIPQTLTLNLKRVDDGKAPVDIIRALFVIAEGLKHKTFNTIELAYNGKTKFILKGDYFKKLGSEYETQNPMYSLRTLPENLYLPNGEQAYGQWTGGILGVLGKQMEDVKDFVEKWISE